MPDLASFPTTGPPGELIPERLRLGVVHELVRPIEKAGRAEDKRLPATGDSGVEEDARPAQRAVGEGHRDAAYHIAKHLVPVEDTERIGARVAIDADPEDQFPLGEVGRFTCWDLFGIHQRGNPILLDPSPNNLLDPDLVPNPRVDEATEIAVEPGEDVRLEGTEVPVGTDLGMLLQPLHPCLPVALYLGSGESLERVEKPAVSVGQKT